MSMTIPQIETDEVKLDAQTIRECQSYVGSLQRQLDKAVKDNDRKKIRRFTDLLTRRSRAVKILAINRVTKVNKGRYTPGVDRKRILRSRKVAHHPTRGKSNRSPLGSEANPQAE